MTKTPVVRSDLPLPLLQRGKVRDVYEVGEDRLLIVATDRVSAFDVVMAEPIPKKGEVLTMITAWWLTGPARSFANHLISVDPDRIVSDVPELDGLQDQWSRRAMLVRRAAPVPVECVVRGYLSGSAWREYRRQGTLAGEALPQGLLESERLPDTIFSPATKAQEGHDENITFTEMIARLGPALANRLRARALELYALGVRVADEAGIILADTKFEFGIDGKGEILVIDEVMTPDSSRFWPKEHYQVGRGQPSLDKQPIRDFLDAVPDWDKLPPAPTLPPEVVQAASERYQAVFRRLTGTDLDDFEAPAPAQAGP